MLQSLKHQSRSQLITLPLRLLRNKVSTIQSLKYFPKCICMQMVLFSLKRFDTNEIGLPFKIANYSNYCVWHENVLCEMNIQMHLFDYEIFITRMIKYNMNECINVWLRMCYRYVLGRTRPYLCLLWSALMCMSSGPVLEWKCDELASG